VLDILMVATLAAVVAGSGAGFAAASYMLFTGKKTPHVSCCQSYTALDQLQPAAAVGEPRSQADR
jgi:hypothetical protein